MKSGLDAVPPFPNVCTFWSTSTPRLRSRRAAIFVRIRALASEAIIIIHLKVARRF
jgi:hypothetical protein